MDMDISISPDSISKIVSAGNRGSSKAALQEFSVISLMRGCIAWIDPIHPRNWPFLFKVMNEAPGSYKIESSCENSAFILLEGNNCEKIVEAAKRKSISPCCCRIS